MATAASPSTPQRRGDVVRSSPPPVPAAGALTGRPELPDRTASMEGSRRGDTMAGGRRAPGEDAKFLRGAPSTGAKQGAYTGWGERPIPTGGNPRTPCPP